MYSRSFNSPENDLSAREAVQKLIDGGPAFIDVRSEGEFAQGHIPGFNNAPVLNDAERHQVGLCYRSEGQDRAIELGRRLVSGATKEARIRGWQSLASPAGGEAVVACWRGGMRSRLTCQALQASGVAAVCVRGGYKAMRRELLDVFERLPPVTVLTGYTGSGKTRLLRSLTAAWAIDLESLASHRGSSFGSIAGKEQPSQAAFENHLALALWVRAGKILMEDESRYIGRLQLPQPLLGMMTSAPLVAIEESSEVRSLNICAEYLSAPIAAGSSLEALAGAAERGIHLIRKRLGGALADQALDLCRQAFAASSIVGFDASLDLHLQWVRLLLDQYYDRMYRHAFERNQRGIAFKGDLDSCREWILQGFA